MADILKFPGEETFLELDPKEMLTNAMEEYDFDKVILIGTVAKKDDKGRSLGSDLTICTSTSDTAEIIFQIEIAKKALLDGTEY